MPGSIPTACSRPTISSPGEDCFVAATGVTTGSLLRGVSYRKDSVVTHSIVMRSRSGTVRMIEARHELSKIRRLSGRTL